MFITNNAIPSPQSSKDISFPGRAMPSNNTFLRCTIFSTGYENAPFFLVIQTSDLRLPRSNRWTHRVLEARSPISPKDLPRPKTLSVNGDPGKSGLSQAGKVVVEATRNGTCTSETSLKPMIMCSMGEHALSRNSARQGLGGIRDADQGRRILPVRTMASGQVSPGEYFFVFPR